MDAPPPPPAFAASLEPLPEPPAPPAPQASTVIWVMQGGTVKVKSPAVEVIGLITVIYPVLVNVLVLQPFDAVNVTSNVPGLL